MANRDLIARVFEASRKIRYAALFSRDGTKIEGGMRPRLAPLEPDKEAEDIDRQTTLYCSRLMAQEKDLGKTDFVFARTDRVDILVMPVRSSIILQVTAEPSEGLKLLQLVRRVLNAN